jgi:hypothetical protein
MMSSTCFELEGSSSGRRLYIQARYSGFHMHRCKQSCTAHADADACKTHYTMPVHTAVFLKMNPRARNMC